MLPVGNKIVYIQIEPSYKKKYNKNESDSMYYIYCLQFDYEYIDPIKLNAEIQKNGATNSIQRISCTMTQKEFVEKYVRTSTPVLIQGCNFNWLDDVDLDLPNAAKVNQENHNIALKLIA